MSQPAMDAGAFAEMKELMGNSFVDIISMCLQNLPEQLVQIEAAIKSQDADALFDITHKMKSSCGSIGAFGLAEKIEAIELIGREGSTEVSDQAYDDMLNFASQVIAILTAELNPGSA
jgi:HPt (histidine-containing phosphotransfer) domain-containing protein